MAQTVRELMTDHPSHVDATTPISHAARLMRDNGIGDVLVTEGRHLRGIVTDRDIVVRAIAEGLNPDDTTVDAVFSGEPVSVQPDTPVEEAVRMMREHAVRRLPVVENGEIRGVVSIGDLAIERDSDSVLAAISAARPNN